jgi:hypothetical protein
VGTWIEITRSWHDTAVTHCALCGRLVPRRVWQVEIDGQKLPFCNEECEGLYRSYWLPKYGHSVSSSANSLLPAPRGERLGMRGNADDPDGS